MCAGFSSLFLTEAQFGGKMCGDSRAYLRRWLLMMMLILAAAPSAVHGCPRSCVCSVPSEVHCTFKYLSTVPDQIQPHVEKVNLGYNSITLLREGDLSGLKRLDQLLLHSNTIHKVEDGAFEDLKSLQVLKMSYNKIKELNKDTFKGLESLLRLHVDHNDIHFINPEAFNGLNNLQLLNLEGNQLQQLHPDTFTTLRHSQVFKVSSLRTIQLSDNLLTRLPENIFSGCTQLENLFLHGNRWRCDCHMRWFPAWTQRHRGLLKCKRDRRYPRGQLCPVCEKPSLHHSKPLSLLPADAFTCSKPWIQQHTRRKNTTLEQGDFISLHPKDFIAPLGSTQMNFTDQFGNDASLSCTVQRPNKFENLTLTPEDSGGANITKLSASITSYLVCNVDSHNIQQLWQILAGYSDFPLRLERGSMLARSPEMVYKYTQIKSEEGMFASIQADVKAAPAWLMQSEVNLQLDRTTTTYSTLHIKYQSEVNLRVENSLPKKDRYSWAMIKRDNLTKTEHAVLSGGVAQLTCQIQGDPTPFLEWILPDGSKVRAPYTSEDRRIIISADGKLTLRGADTSDSGLYFCITTNYLDADILVHRLTVLSSYVEDEEFNGGHVPRQLGENLALDCITTGSPEASVQWILPDQTILDKSLGNRKVFDNGTLLIEGLTARDRGFYRCLAANYLGVDLFVSQVTVEGSDSVPVGEGEGSGLEQPIKEDASTRNEDMTSPVHSGTTSQESRTVTSDRPYPRLRGEERSPKRLRQRGRGTFRNRHNWRSRVFAKASKDLDRETFAKFMKQAEDRANARSATGGENTNHVPSAEDDTGSGELLREDGVIIMHSTQKPIIATPPVHRREEAENITSHDAEDKPSVHMRNHQISNSVDLVQVSGTTDTQTAASYFQPQTRPTVTQKEIVKSEIDVVLNTNSHRTLMPDLNGRPHFHGSGNATEPPSLNSPASLPSTPAGSSHLLFSGELPQQLDATTQSALTFTSDPRVTPMMDDPGRVNLVVHTDPANKRTFTAVTTTEGQQEQITFHTMQTIKSSHLPPGSTIISQQQIHIIPKKSRKRGGGRRKSFQSQRRVIKPNKISDIQSIINKIQQASIKERNSTISYSIRLTTDTAHDDGKPDNGPQMKSTEAPTSAATPSQTATTSFTTESTATNVHITSAYITPKKELTISTTPATTSPPETVRGDRTSTKTQAEVQRTPSTHFTTSEQLSTEPMDISTSRTPDSTESPSGDDNGAVSLVEFTTGMPSVEHMTTTSSTTTVEPPSELETLPFPPTVKPSTTELPDEASSSGSGGLPNDWLIISTKPKKTQRFKGPNRKVSSGRQTIPESMITETTKTQARKWATAIPQLVDINRPVYPKQMPEQKTDTEEADSDRGTNRPVDYTTTMFPSTSKGFYTSVRNSIYVRPTKQATHGATDHRKSIMTNTSTAQTTDTFDSAEKELDKSTASKAEREHTRHNNKEDRNSVISRVTGSAPTNTHGSHFETTTHGMTSKPRIVGGNAASFTVLSNSDAFLPCEAVGHPKPDISWKRFSPRTGSTVAIDGSKKKYWILDNGTLSIQNANIQDQGQYLCLAENSYGSDKLLVTLSVVAYPSRILEPKIREMKLHVGNTAMMNCQAEGRPTPAISWILANQTQVREQSTSFGRTAVISGGTLVIENVSVFDRGLYKCIASNPAGVDTVTVRLQVVAAPPDILEDKRQQVKVAVHQSVWLPCTGKGSPIPAIHWVLLDGKVVQPNRSARDARVTVFYNGTLLIKDVTQRDMGKYECIATSSTGSERRVVSLTVEKQESAPQIVEISQRVTELSFGDQLKLDCAATGDPKPRIIWRLPSKAVVDQWHRMGSRIKVLENGTLLIQNVIDKDDGDYLCVARSRIGDDLQLLKVRVSMQPAKIEAKLYDKKQVTYGNDLKVDCKASGAPKPEISWGLPDGTVVNKALQEDASAGGARHRRYTLFDNGTLYLNQVGMSEEGDYTCFAENQVGKDEMHVHITVVAAIPKILQPRLTNLKVKPGGNVRFDCEAVGEPKPKILWMLPSNDIIAASNERYLMHVNGSLDIRDVNPFDMGEYVCIARNHAGEANKVFRLDVDGNPPVINGYRQNRTVIKEYATKYSRKLIDCKADGNPTPSITWIMPDSIFLKAPYFGSRIIVHYNGTLEIRNVRPTDTAEFICLARNDGGEAVLVVELEVTHMMRRPIFKNPLNERVSSSIGKSIILNCSADGHPKPEIIWTLPDGKRLTSGHINSSHHHIAPDGSLAIYESQIRDSGKYRCGAKNMMGYIEKLIILDVGAKPYILSHPRGIIRGMFGETLVLHCLSDGSPRPSISWTMPGGHTLIVPQVFGRHQLFENGTLFVRDTTLLDKGNYICRARNEAGLAALTVPVMIVAYPPRITTAPPSNVQVVAGTPTLLNCAASGIPRPEITWEMPDHSVLSIANQAKPLSNKAINRQGSLLIHRFTVSDVGTYKCFAKNQVGTDLKATYVHAL
ncbi:immunoglobulin superfamily member 10 [Neosynchiropus ocellatus]